MPIFINTLFFIDMHDVNKSLNKVFTNDTLVETKELTRLSITAKCGYYLYQARGNKRFNDHETCSTMRFRIQNVPLFIIKRIRQKFEFTSSRCPPEKYEVTFDNS